MKKQQLQQHRQLTFPPLILFLFLFLLSLPLSTSSELYSLVYKGCASSTSSSVTSTSLSSLTSSLLSTSSPSLFHKTTDSSTGLFGLYQCRGDLTPSQCSSCVTRIPSMWVSLCDSSAAAARVQLSGCYALYRSPSFPDVSGVKLLYKSCSKSTTGGDRSFEESRGTALAGMQNGVAGSENGFYATSYGNVHAMAQCEGDLSAGDCGECVAKAVEKAEVECGGSASAQVYLDKCFINYSYYPHGAPRGGDASGGGGDGDGGDGGGGGSGQTGKTVAIVVGAAAGVGFVVICLLFVRSLCKKEDY